MYRQIHGKYSNTLAKLSLLSLSAVSVLGYTPGVARAASLVDASDTLTTINASSKADHTVVFKLGAGKTFSANEKISVDFPAGFTAAGTWVAGDFTFSDGASKTVTSDCSTTSGVSFAVDNANAKFDFTACSAYVESSANAIMTVTIAGTDTDGTLTNPTAGSYTVLITNDNGASEDDTTQVNIPIISDDSVNITATVDPTLSFSISDQTVGFGTLSASAVRYADGATDGEASSTVAHTLSVATNATSGYVITYKGDTLRSLANSSDTITPATITGDVNGTQNSEQFALAVSGTGPTFVSAYSQASNNWSFVADTTTQIASENAPANTRTIDVRYLANISDVTEAGAYVTDVYYIATGTF